MQIILDVTGLDTSEDVEEMKAYVRHLQNMIDARKRQNFPGMWVENALGGVWVKGVKLDA